MFLFRSATRPITHLRMMSPKKHFGSKYKETSTRRLTCLRLRTSHSYGMPSRRCTFHWKSLPCIEWLVYYWFNGDWKYCEIYGDCDDSCKHCYKNGGKHPVIFFIPTKCFLQDFKCWDVASFTEWGSLIKISLTAYAFRRDTESFWNASSHVFLSIVWSIIQTGSFFRCKL